MKRRKGGGYNPYRRWKVMRDYFYLPKRPWWKELFPYLPHYSNQSRNDLIVLQEDFIAEIAERNKISPGIGLSVIGAMMFIPSEKELDEFAKKYFLTVRDKEDFTPDKYSRQLYFCKECYLVNNIPLGVFPRCIDCHTHLSSDSYSEAVRNTEPRDWNKYNIRRKYTNV